jgi:hypothetical protein
VDAFCGEVELSNGYGNHGNSQGKSLLSDEDKSVDLLALHTEIQQIAATDKSLLDHALHHVQVTKGKLEDILVSREDQVEHPVSQVVYRTNDGDASLKHKKSVLKKR